VSCRPANGHSFRWLVITASIMLWGGCCLQPLQQQFIGDFGRIEWRKAKTQGEGIVVGVPHGIGEPAAVEYARSITSETGGGLVIAYGFQSERIPVTRPLVRTTVISSGLHRPNGPGSIYPEFKAALINAANGPVKFYVGIRIADAQSKLTRIEVATSGLTFEQVAELKKAYVRIRDRTIKDVETPKLEIKLNPLDDILWNPTGVKGHGVLMLAEKGLILRIPSFLSSSEVKKIYRQILTAWISEASSTSLWISSGSPETRVEMMRYGRIDTIASRKQLYGVVLGAPHGSFDWHTAELVEELSFRTSIAAVVARGFTPTECDGWRINVNRPTERRYGATESERETDRAKVVYQRFVETVAQAAHAPLRLYVDFHQNSSEDNIDVATVGISLEEAKAIKSAYTEIRDRVLKSLDQLRKVKLAIEPLDKVTFTARGAKSNGILKFAKQSLHIELPAHRILYSTQARRAYTEILAELISRISARLTSTAVSPAEIPAYSETK
jgi:hypothetical protein